jgi:RHS repeat-associated protein
MQDGIFSIVLLSVCVLLSGSAQGCDSAGGPTACGAGPAAQGNTSATNVGAGNPLNVITGNKYQREVDLPALPGVLGLEIVRHYNSAYSGPKEGHGLIGRGWKLSYETELQAIGKTLQIIEADGTRVIFDRDVRDASRCHSVNPANGSLHIDRNSNGSEEFVWTWTDGRKLHFDGAGKLLSIVAPSGEFLSLIYDNRGVLVKVIDPQGRSLILSYPGSKTASREGRFAGVQAIDSPVGRFRFDYGIKPTEGHRLPDPRILWATLVKVKGPAGSRIYHYDNAQWPTLLTGITIQGKAGGDDGIKSAAQRYATFGYDASGRAVLSTHADQVDQVVLQHSVGSTVLTNSLGQHTRYRHTIIAGEHRLLEVRGAGCASCGETNVRYDYDQLARLTGVTRLTTAGVPWQTIRTELDRLGRVIKLSRISYSHGQSGGAQLSLRYEYEGSAWQPSLIARPSVVAGREAITRIAHNDKGQVLSVTDGGWAPAIDGQSAPVAIARTTSYRYRSIKGRSLLSEIDGPLPNGKSNGPADSDVTRIEYDGQGNHVVEVLAPGKRKSLIQYDGAGRIVKVSDAEGRATDFSMDARGQLLAVTRDGITHSMRYDAFGQPLEAGKSNGNTYRANTRFGFDAAGRNTWIASALGIASTMRYDTEGNLVEAVTQSNTIRQAEGYEYDAWGRLSASTDARGGAQRIRWNARGQLDERIDAMGRATRYRFDANGQIEAVTQAANTAYQAEIRVEIGADGGASTVMAPGGATTRYIRDDFGQTLAVISADSGVSSNSFDAGGRLIASLDANGNRASYEHDVAGRIVRQTISAAKVDEGKTVTTWRHDGARLMEIDHPQQLERYRYDVHGRVEAKTVILKSGDGVQIASTRSYRYDAWGQLVSISLPDGSMLDYVRNGQNQVMAVERHPIATSWLRWLLPRQSIVHHLERDAIGIKSMTYGNGFQASYRRNKEGVLASIDHRQLHSFENTAPLGSAQASNRKTENGAQPVRPAALSGTGIEHHYLWDLQGNLLRDQSNRAVSSHAYDAQDRLITSAGSGRPGAGFARYHYDAGGNRLLEQEGLHDQSDTTSNTIRMRYAPDSHRWQDAEDDHGNLMQARHDAAGQPHTIGRRNYLWNALGQLLEVREEGRSIARYRYNHRGERIGKVVGASHVQYLHEERQLVAELDGSGRIMRQYVYLAGQAVAIIDTPDGALLQGVQQSPLAQFFSDVATIWRNWFSNAETIHYLHNNHLGAPEMATDAKGITVWQASYSPFGRLLPDQIQRTADGFNLPLRLPGQYEDAETGLHYNDHRYYDPDRGQYLTPDPLGLRAGTNGYAYVEGNPLKYIDPSGLVLFAFDGTGNEARVRIGNSLSNVRKFYLAYDEKKNGGKYYITGIGTIDENMKVEGSQITGEGFDDRVKLGFTFLDEAVKKSGESTLVDIDVVGFSRGAAEARVWMNQLVGKLKDGKYTSEAGTTRCVNLRFVGLWDTVSHLGTFSGNDANYDFTISPALKYVAQALALDEHRGGGMNFDGRSIFAAPAVASVASRNELGFVGSHADIGGGYGTGDLSDVALMWMVQQGKNQGIYFKIDVITKAGWDTVTSPLLHDKSGNTQTPAYAPQLGDRHVIYGNGTRVWQGKAVIGGHDTAWAKRFVSYYTHECGPDGSPAVGLVDMKKYGDWLTSQGVKVQVVAPSSSYVCY